MVENDSSFERDTQSDLDLGLRAAFGSESVTGAEGRVGVLDAIEQRLGIATRVHLRDEALEAPLVRTDSPELPLSGAGRDRYQVLGEIARGGVGVVLCGRDTDIGRDVAMKVLQRRHRDNPAMVQRFVEEAQIGGQLQHPGILPVYELGLDDDRRPFFTMKLVKGRTLASLLEERRAPTDERPRFIGIFEQMCQTIAYAHSRGVVHRDLKPSNIMVGQFGEVQVVDWGLAKVLTRGDDHDAAPSPDETVISTVRSGTTGAHSQAGAVMGTPAYMAPEQARGDVHLLDERTDVFALGGVLCEILTGEPPRSARLEECDADEDLVSLARACLSEDRQDRPRTAMAVADAVARHLASVEERARAMEVAMAEARTRATEERKARRLTIALATTILLAVVLGVAAFSLIGWQQDKRTTIASTRMNQALDEANLLFGQALEARVGNTTAWVALRAAGEQVALLLVAGDLDRATGARADAFLVSLETADRQRRLVELIEDIVISGATHFDRVSWVRMADELIAAFQEFGVDLTGPPNADTATLIRDSDFAVHLTEGLELWISAEGQLMGFDAMRYTPDQLRAWVPVVIEADLDPFRQEQRRIYYELIDEFLERGGVSAERAPRYHRRLDALVETLDFEAATPRSLSWLAVCYATSGAPAMANDIYERALVAHPDDYMLNFDYSYLLAPMGRWEEAIRYYLVCLSIRPDNPGGWRSLGVAYRELEQHGQSLRSLERSIALQPDHGPTHLDLGRTFLAMGNRNAADAAFARAVALQPDLADQVESATSEERTPE